MLTREVQDAVVRAAIEDLERVESGCAQEPVAVAKLAAQFHLQNARVTAILAAEGLDTRRSAAAAAVEARFEEFVRAEVAQYQAGTITEMTSLVDLCRRFSCTKNYAVMRLARLGLGELREQARHERSGKTWDALVASVDEEIERFKRREIHRFSSSAILAARFGYQAQTVKTRLIQTGCSRRRDSAWAARRAEFLTAMREETERFRRGEIQHLTPLKTVATEWGYTSFQTQRLLGRYGITDLRTVALAEPVPVASRRPRYRSSNRVRWMTVRAELIACMNEELARFNSGELLVFSTTRQLAERFRCEIVTVQDYLNEAGIVRLMRQAQAVRREAMLAEVRREYEEFEQGERQRVSTSRELGARFGLGDQAARACLIRAGVGRYGQISRWHDQAQRRQELLRQAAAEIEDLRLGAIDHLSTPEELADRFEFAAATVRGWLQRAQLLRPRAAVEKSVRSRRLAPSGDLAWFLGCLCDSGSIQPDHGRISLEGREPSLRAEFRRIGERLLHVPGHEYTDAAGRSEIVFFCKSAMTTFGDLQGDHWIEALQHVHAWILRSDRYLWRLLEAILETGGGITTNGVEHKISFHTTSRAVGQMLLEFLWRVGVQRARFTPSTKEREGLRGVCVSTWRDVKHLADHIHSCIPTQEARLQQLRERIPVRSQVNSADDLVTAWGTVRALTSRTPTRDDLTRLFREERTPYGPQSYAKWLGDGSYRLAVDRLERIYAERAGEPAPAARIVHRRGDITHDTALAEWSRLRSTLGHVPGFNELQRLRHDKLTLYQNSVYARLFGGGNWGQAVAELERLIAST